MSERGEDDVSAFFSGPYCGGDYCTTKARYITDGLQTHRQTVDVIKLKHNAAEK